MAENTFKSGINVRPDAYSLLCNLGALYRTTERFEEAEELFKKAIKLHPKNLSVLVNYANLKSDLNQIDAACFFLSISIISKLRFVCSKNLL